MSKSTENNKQNGKQEQSPPKTQKVKQEQKYCPYNYVMDYKTYIKFLEDFEKKFKKKY